MSANSVLPGTVDEAFGKMHITISRLPGRPATETPPSQGFASLWARTDGRVLSITTSGWLVVIINNVYISALAIITSQ